MDQDKEKIACQVCRKEIPKAVALHPAGQEYILNFCSTECLDFWQTETEEQARDKESKK